MLRYKPYNIVLDVQFTFIFSNNSSNLELMHYVLGAVYERRPANG